VSNLRAAARSWWSRFRRRKKISRVRHVTSMNQVPRQLGSTLFVVENSGIPKWAVFECPCRCGSRVDVNLMGQTNPHWKLIKHGKEVSIQPSIWQPLERCGSHFFVTRNKIRWVEVGLCELP
jgi:hypothetical protein